MNSNYVERNQFYSVNNTNNTSYQRNSQWFSSKIQKESKMTDKKSNKNRIIVLSKCQQALSVANLNENCERNFYLSQKLQIPVMHVLWACFVGIWLMEVWNVYEHSYSSMTVYQQIGTIQTFFVYLALYRRKRIIGRCMDRLQEIVDKRCASSSNAYDIYKASQVNCSRITSGLISGSVASAALLLLPIALSPIPYLNDEFPRPR